MLSAVILEDEIPAAERLRVLLNDCQVTLLATFSRAQHALEWFALHQADVVFVDIGLPEINGLEFADKLSRIAGPMPALVFTTAYEEHALRAFELAATDYLLKPIKIARLRDALTRIRQARGITHTEEEFACFNVINRERMQQIPWQKVAYLMADQKVVWLYTYDGGIFELPKTLIYWEEILGEKALRIHRNALVMRHALHSLVRLDASESEENARWGARLVDRGEVLPVSRRQLALLRRELS
ncbi:MAG: LytTR family DNA-binding domain-containing protein [Neisseria sp.]|nr:LytTR family DNA-binding domain-containing protein [Neisseria sp.]